MVHQHDQSAKQNIIINRVGLKQNLSRKKEQSEVTTVFNVML